jgi:hypothetical protein
MTRKRLVTEFTDKQATANLIEGAIAKVIERTGPLGPLSGLSTTQVSGLAACVLYALGEVYERQFYPSDREECQAVARELLRRAQLPVPRGLIIPDVA